MCELEARTDDLKGHDKSPGAPPWVALVLDGPGHEKELLVRAAFRSGGSSATALQTCTSTFSSTSSTSTSTSTSTCTPTSYCTRTCTRRAHVCIGSWNCACIGAACAQRKSHCGIGKLGSLSGPAGEGAELRDARCILRGLVRFRWGLDQALEHDAGAGHKTLLAEEAQMRDQE